jgi:serine/tyrosine/threonine adenylyltransferase
MTLPDSATDLEKYIASLLTLSPGVKTMDRGKATSDWKSWLEKYARRIETERDQWGDDLDGGREKAAKGANPRFILRQWVLEEVIKKVGDDPEGGKRILGKVMKVCRPRNNSFVLIQIGE